MIQIIDECLSEEICNDLISHLENNKNIHNTYYPNNNNRIFITYINLRDIKKFYPLIDQINKYVKGLNNCEIHKLQVVKWPNNCSQGLHYDKTLSKTVYSSIGYLNDEYMGGQTFFEEGTIFKPIKGRVLFFDGMKYKHGVTPVKNGPRYTLASWYKRIEK